MLNVTAQRGSARNVGSGEWNTALAVRNAAWAWKRAVLLLSAFGRSVWWVLAGAGVKVLEADALHDSSHPLSQAIDCECDATPKTLFPQTSYCLTLLLCVSLFLLELLRCFFCDLIKVCLQYGIVAVHIRSDSFLLKLLPFSESRRSKSSNTWPKLTRVRLMDRTPNVFIQICSTSRAELCLSLGLRNWCACTF